MVENVPKGIGLAKKGFCVASRRGRIVVLALAGALSLGPTAAVQAHSKSWVSRVTIGYGGKTFSGTVSSAKAKCVAGRRVTLVKAGKGVIASTTTNSSGGWSIRKPKANGSYRARVANRFRGSYGHFHECRGDRSAVISL